MTLGEWLAGKPRGEVSKLSHRTGVSMLTIRRVRDGRLLRNSMVAQAISDGTFGEVAPESMLEGREGQPLQGYCCQAAGR